MAYITQNTPLRGTLAGWIETLFDSLRQRRENYLRYRQTADELHALSDRELADIGIARCDIPTVARQSIHEA
jgi:uncharacterized protein YjiS (DUF1127 family)